MTLEVRNLVKHFDGVDTGQARRFIGQAGKKHRELFAGHGNAEDAVSWSVPHFQAKSIGYALAPLDSDDPQGLLRYADAAMYAGKQRGKHSVQRIPATAAPA